MNANLDNMLEIDANQQFVAELYENYKYIMYGTAKRFISDDNIVEDLVHESLIKLISKVSILSNLNKPALIAYIVYTVKNITFNYLRDTATEKNHILFEVIDNFENVYSTEIRAVESNVIYAEWSNQLKDIIRKLPEKQQELLIRKYYLKQSDVEIAKSLKCKPSSVRMMLTRARRDAVVLLEKENFKYEII